MICVATIAWDRLFIILKVPYRHNFSVIGILLLFFDSSLKLLRVMCHLKAVETVNLKIIETLNRDTVKERVKTEAEGAIHSTKIPTGPTGKGGPPRKVDQFFRNFSGWTEPIH